ncbi:type II toxin-antitoxin system PemK/MazF family toxin [Limnoraphis robusta]|uniref:mRNA interferase n=1 Tax=Limnoraphis robusta CCNP1315 TaxID=3110306 RepID=A0ABU5TR11_9CYAN|nr:type II toxin-antitoxin system PemK/MazF family toxin [Limnoraphis robusta]MEA5517357.1 type II toxin-antitoxin system PemK/MazF family toxin [Limnoraphis robusta CCNP1315]MEA5546054.1 type II toxin-antitoxin system PemK/MazF family toxin [Limnoraphis robusta CCNP1324]
MTQILRGEIWLVDLNPVRGREQAGKRPCLIISVNLFNQGASGLVVVLPITSKQKGVPFHVEINPTEGGVRVKSFIKCEDVRSISVERLDQRWGVVSSTTLAAVEDRLRILMGL